MRTLVRACVAAAAWSVAAAGAAETRVAFPSLDGAGDSPVLLSAIWMPAPASGSAATAAPARLGAVVLLHGCNGLWDRQGRLGARYRDYARIVHRTGLHVLVVDSFKPRQETELCTQRNGARRVNQSHRRLDTLAAIAWLAARDDVDAERIGLLGWSHGGSTVLAASNLRHRDVQAAAVKPAFAVAFYPGCAAERARRYEPAAPLLLLLGDADDWTPAEPCAALAREAAGAVPSIDVERYAGAHHGFDSELPVRLRSDVPNGVKPGAGVHVGGQPAARQASRERLLRFLAERKAS